MTCDGYVGWPTGSCRPTLLTCTPGGQLLPPFDVEYRRRHGQRQRLSRHHRGRRRRCQRYRHHHRGRRRHPPRAGRHRHRHRGQDTRKMLEPIRILFLGRSQRTRRPGDHVDCHCDRVYAAAAVTATRGSTQATAEARRARRRTDEGLMGATMMARRAASPARGAPRGGVCFVCSPVCCLQPQVEHSA